MFNIHKSRQFTHIITNEDDFQKGKMLKKANLTVEEDKQSCVTGSFHTFGSYCSSNSKSSYSSDESFL